MQVYINGRQLENSPIAITCSTCGGSGRVIRHYEKMSRWENCSTCGGSGQIKTESEK